MRKLFVSVFILLFCVSCDFFLKVDSDGLKVEIGDNGSDNKTNNSRNDLYVYAVGEALPFGRVKENGGTFVYSAEAETKTTALTDARSSLSRPFAVEIRLTDICSGGAVVEKAADFYAEAVLVACDLSGCADPYFDMFSYAERNGFDAYCSAE